MTKRKEFRVGDWVYLKRPPKSKLDNGWVGPFEIVEFESPQRIKLRLVGKTDDKDSSTEMATSNQLKLVIRPNEEMDNDEDNIIQQSNNNNSNKKDNDQMAKDEQEPSSLNEINDNKWEAEEIVNSRTKGNKTEYKVSWKPTNGVIWADTWEPASNLDGAQQLITEYNNRVKKKREKKLTNLIRIMEADSALKCLQ